MSANDPLPSLRQAELLILEAMARGRPVIGHCLGGQLMARALGARVGAVARRPRSAGIAIDAARPAPAARQWFGDGAVGAGVPVARRSLRTARRAPRLWRAAPPARTRPLRSVRTWRCSSMWRSIEEKLRRWSLLDTRCLSGRCSSAHATVHSGAAHARGAWPNTCRAQQALAERVYARWLAGVVDRAALTRLSYRERAISHCGMRRCCSCRMDFHWANRRFVSRNEAAKSLILMT